MVYTQIALVEDLPGPFFISYVIPQYSGAVLLLEVCLRVAH